MVSQGGVDKGLTECNVRTATWAVASPIMGKLVDTVFQSSSGNVTAISAHEYGRLKALQSGGAKGRPSDAGRDAADTSLVAETDPMIIEQLSSTSVKDEFNMA